MGMDVVDSPATMVLMIAGSALNPSGNIISTFIEMGADSKFRITSLASAALFFPSTTR